MLGKAIGIDFGTSSIKFYKNGEGIILHEKSVIAIYNKSHTFCGRQMRRMICMRRHRQTFRCLIR